MAKRQKPPGRIPAEPATDPGPSRTQPLLDFLAKRALWLAIASVAVATVRIAATYPALSHTVDEPAHIACGMEYLAQGTYRLEPQHPPLTRAAVALPLRLSGIGSQNKPEMWAEGLAILTQGDFTRNLTLARLGNLPFFWIACWVVFLLASRIAPAAAFPAVFLFTFTPSVLAHAGLATTDMGFTALFLAACHSLWRWLQQPDARRAALLGLTVALAVLAKFSTLAFFPVTAAIAIAGFWVFCRPADPRRYAAPLGIALVTGAFVLWAGYRFSWGIPPGWSFAVPAPALFAGVDQVRHHNTTGHLTYLLGQVNTVGWWYFYLVALAVKTPLTVLILGLGGLAILTRGEPARRGWIVPGFVLGVLIYASLFSNIVIGTRHVLPVYAGLSVAGGCAAAWLLRRAAAGAAATGALLLWLLAGSVAAHPNYLGYFNVVAGDKPESYLVDSDLDWGQDVKRLAARLRELGATQVALNQFAPGDLTALYGMPPVQELSIDGPRPGWNAVGLTRMKLGLFGGDRFVYDPGFQFWPEQFQANERVGSGILLFYAQPETAR